jgi:SOS-response transcriptional repressor LexA
VDVARRFDDDRIQQKVLDEIINALKDGAPVPTTRELARTVHTVESRIQTALESLEDDGYIERDRDASGKCISRSMRSTKIPRTRFIPLMGRIAAGNPIPNYGEDIEEYMPLPVSQVRGDGAYAVRVVGDSMTGDSILDGDYVVVTPDPEPKTVRWSSWSSRGKRQLSAYTGRRVVSAWSHRILIAGGSRQCLLVIGITRLSRVGWLE